MAKKTKNIIVKQGLDGWVMTYGDMMSLLLTFFVLIVSFSSMQETKFEEAAASLRDAFGILHNPESVIAFNTPIIPRHNPESRDADVLYEVRSIEKMIMEDGLENQVAVEVREEGILFRIQAPFLFASGSAQLESAPKDLLVRMAAMFAKFPYHITINGHTDNIPIRSARYPSNWELSAARSVSVARYFQSLGVPPENLAATGFGEYRPLESNDTAEGRSRNRRVEVFLKLEHKDLAKEKRLPLGDGAPADGNDEVTQVENKSERQIIDPVTNSLFHGRPLDLPGSGK